MKILAKELLPKLNQHVGGKKLSWSFEIVEHPTLSTPMIKHNGITEVKANQLGSTEPLKDELKQDILEVIEDLEN